MQGVKNDKKIGYRSSLKEVLRRSLTQRITCNPAILFLECFCFGSARLRGKNFSFVTASLKCIALSVSSFTNFLFFCII